MLLSGPKHRGSTPIRSRSLHESAADISLCQHFAANLAAIDDFDRPVARSHQLLVGRNSQAVINCGCPVFDVQRLVFWFTRC